MTTRSACGVALTLAIGCASAPPTATTRDVPKIESTVAPKPTAKAPPKPAEAPAGPRFEMLSPATIAAGTDFSCAITAGQVRCWGNNRNGALGDGTTTPRDKPVTVAGVSGAGEITAGGGSSCARSGEDVRCWGELAKGGAPVAITGLVKPQRMAAHGQHGCAIEAAGSVRCWDKDELASYPIAAIDDAVGIAVGVHGACVRERHGDVKCWKDGRPAKVKGLTNVVELAMADEASYERHACARTNDDAVLCWKMEEKAEAKPAPTSIVVPRRILLGSKFGCIANDIGELDCWDGPYHETGHYMPSGGPTRHGKILGASEVTAGRRHICQRLPTGEVFCMGGNDEGQLGVPGTITARPHAVVITDAKSLVPGRRATCAVRDGGDAHCWGDIYYGTQDRPFLERTRVDQAKGIRVLARSNNHSCAIVGRAVSCWGSRYHGELGAESAPPPKSKSPFARSMLGNSTVRRVKGIASATDIAVTDRSSCAVIGGTVRCWGATGLATTAKPKPSGGFGFSMPCGSYGKDDKRCAELKRPRTVPGLRGVKEIASDGSSLCALTATAVWCWDERMLSSGGKPAKVQGFSSPKHLAMGFNRVCAFDGSAVMCRKFGGVAQALNPLPKGTTVVSIGVGDAHTCVATSAGEVLCSGGGDNGELGDGRRQSSFGTWVTATNVAGAVEVVAGPQHTCSRSNNGALHCWGAPPKMVAAEDATPYTMVPQRVEGL